MVVGTTLSTTQIAREFPAKHLHDNMVNDALPAGRTFQEVVHLALECGADVVPALGLHEAARHLAPLGRATVQGHLHRSRTCLGATDTHTDT